MVDAGVTSLDISLVGLGAGLKANRVLVPRYQRSYAWEPRHVRDLLSDLSAAIEANEPDYFLGSVVVTQGARTCDVVDGQQRLATATMLLSAIRDYLVGAGETEMGSDVERDFLRRRERRSQAYVARLHLNGFDNDFFAKRVLSKPKSPDRDTKPTRDSHERLESAFKLCVDHVAKIAAAAGNPVDRLNDWVDYIEDQAKVIWVQVPDEANAFVIFETLNDRGLDLSVADLLKNYLFGRADDRIDEAQQHWTNMLGALESGGGEAVAVAYVRHLWASKHGPTRERALYSEIKKTVNSKQGAIDLAKQLSDEAAAYAAMLNPGHPRWKALGGNTRKDIETLLGLKMEQFRPLLLAALASFSNAQIKKVLSYLVSASVRFLVVGGLGGGTMERVYSDTAAKVRAKTITSARAVAKELASTVPSDKEFETSFESVKVPRAYLARYYLRVLEREQCGEAQPEFVPNDNEDEINLEHILPQTPSAAWKMKEEVARAYYQRLGNLALMKARPNTQAANKGFSAKKTYYKKSKLHWTNSLATRTSWNEREIEKRQKELAGLAAAAWPL